MKALKWMGMALCHLGAVAMWVTLLASLLIVTVFYYFSRDLPDFRQLSHYEPPIVTRLYAADGKLLAEYATEKRIYVPLSAMPRQLTEAFLSAEDRNFYKHGGIDPVGLIRAALTNFQNFGQNKSLVGGSTITQQVVKNFLLGSEKSYERKIKEAILALRVSQVFSKDRILELYLNEIYLGLGSYGVAAASLNYFNKSLDELTLEEAAFLAALPKAPANYNPKRHYEAARERRDWVLGRMLEDDYVTPSQAKAALAAPITLRERDPTEVVRADFFAEEVRRKLAEMYGASVLYEGGLTVKTTLDPHMQELADQSLRETLVTYDRKRGYRGPLSHLPSIENWSKQLADFPKQNIPLFGLQRLAVVIKLEEKRAQIGLEGNETGYIPLESLKWTRRVYDSLTLGPEIRKPSDIMKIGDVVMVAPLAVAKEPEKSKEKEKAKEKDEKEKGQAYDLQQIPEINGALVALDPHTGRVLALSGGYSYGGTEFNRATQAKRQPGSAFKPFVYLAALEAGFTPASIVLDAPVELSQGAGLPAWRPQNYADEYLGPATLRVGLEKSRNTMTVRLGQMIGIDRVIAVGQRFGIYDELPRNFSIVLGAAETTLLRLTNAYGMIVNGGKRIASSLIERIDDRNGRVLYRRDQRPCFACRVDNAEMARGEPPLLSDNRDQVVDPRIAYQMVSMLQGVVERGTAVRAKVIGKPVAGKTGTTNESMDTWFVGFSPDLVVGVFVGYDKPKSLGHKETGSSVALPGFISFMQTALAEKPAQPFRIPPGVELVRVQLKTGHPPGEESGLEGEGPVIMEAFVSDSARPGPYDSEKVAEAAQTSGPEDEEVPIYVPGATEGDIAPMDIPPIRSNGLSRPNEAPTVGTGGLY